MADEEPPPRTLSVSVAEDVRLMQHTPNLTSRVDSSQSLPWAGTLP